MFTLEQHLVVIISSLKPLQKRTIPNSHTSNSFIKEDIKPSDLPWLLFHAEHASCFFPSVPLIWRNYIIMTEELFPLQPDIAKTGQETGLEFPSWLLQEPVKLQGQQSAHVEPCLHTPFVFEPVTIVLCQLSSCWALEKPSWISHITVTPSGTTSSGSAVDQEHSY